MMKQVPLLFLFLLGLIATLFGTVFFPKVRLFTFAPFFATVYNRKTLPFALWIAALCGLVVDLLSSQLHLGFYALSYALTTLVVYHQKRHFFEDKPLAFSLFTALISCAATLLQLCLLYMMERKISFSWKLIGTDLALMPLLDGAYAFFWFTCPTKAYHALKKVKWNWRFWIRKQEEGEENA